MEVMLSIKPKYTSKIFDGSKKFEYRRTIWSKIGVETVFVYATTPIRKVIGEFTISSIMESDLETLWAFTSFHSGISAKEFVNYFKGKERGYAISIGHPTIYKTPYPLTYFGISRPPQNFMYLKEA